MLEVKPATIRAYHSYPSLSTYTDIAVKYNPTELTFDKAVHVAEITIPGLDSPLLQFVRGQNEKLTLDLFCDTTELGGMSGGAVSVVAQTDQIYQLVKIVPETHAPPVCDFSWGGGFPGSATSGDIFGGQQRTFFRCVVESVKQRFTVFSTQGVPLRATLSVTLREFRPLDEQLKSLKLSSPDRTGSLVLQNGESLSSIAAHHYLNPSRWRAIAQSNGIDDPRRLAPGTVLILPCLEGSAA